MSEMDRTLEALSAIDRAAQKIASDAEETKKNLGKQNREALQEFDSRIDRETQETLDRLRQETESRVQSETEELQRENERRKEHLRKSFEAHHSAWAGMLFDRLKEA